MLSFEKFFGTISKLLPSPSAPGNLKELAQLDPDRIYIENVRSVLGVSVREAQRICETAARQGVFDRYVEVLCPDGSVAASADSEEHLPPEVSCWEEDTGSQHLEETEIPVSKLRTRIYYRLHESEAHTR
jgi:hypothetical protein